MLRRNLIANYLGQGWTALMGLAFIPLYIKYLGIEAFGLIGIFAMLQAWLTLLDMGMTPTITREMARFTSGAHTAKSVRDLLRSFEVVCLGIAMLISLAIWTVSGSLASDWLRVERLPVDAVAQAFAIMGIVMALRFVEGLYRGAIIGLQKQVWLNVVTAGLATVRGLGAVGVLMWITPGIEAFFLWQAAVSLVTVICFAGATYAALPKATEPGHFSRPALIGVWRFAAGMMATTFLALLLTQVDKILLSRLLSLETFGYYALAAAVANALYYLVGPIAQAFYPRLTELVTRGDEAELAAVYHNGAQMVSVLVGSAALILMLFSERLLVLWTGDLVLARDTAPLVTLLALGTLLNGLMHIPYMLQLAHGWSGFAARVNLVAVIVLVPAILWATPRYGAIGAAWVWVILNASYVLIAIHFMHRRLLPREKWLWYGRDLALPILTAALTVSFFQLMSLDSPTILVELGWLLVAGAITVTTAAFAVPTLRCTIIQKISNRTKLICLKKA